MQPQKNRQFAKTTDKKRNQKQKSKNRRYFENNVMIRRVGLSTFYKNQFFLMRSFWAQKFINTLLLEGKKKLLIKLFVNLLVFFKTMPLPKGYFFKANQESSERKSLKYTGTRDGAYRWKRRGRKAPKNIVHTYNADTVGGAARDIFYLSQFTYKMPYRDETFYKLTKTNNFGLRPWALGGTYDSIRLYWFFLAMESARSSIYVEKKTHARGYFFYVKLVPWWRQYAMVLKYLRDSLRHKDDLMRIGGTGLENKLKSEFSNVLLGDEFKSQLLMFKLDTVVLLLEGRLRTHYRWRWR